MFSTEQWKVIRQSLHESGYVHIENVLSKTECDDLCRMYRNDSLYRSTITMERYRFGKGEYRYFRYPLPDLIRSMREKIYPQLSAIANEWMDFLRIEKRFPLAHQELIDECHKHGQLRPTPLILRYEQGGFNTLHQDLYGEVYFPFQVVFMLTERNVDYHGGEFVIVEQIPRAQSRAHVIKANRGDAVIFTTNFRPVKGSKGHYRAVMKHGVSEIKSGTRYALGMIFHDAV